MAAQSMWTPLSQQQPAMWPCSASVTGTGARSGQSRTACPFCFTLLLSKRLKLGNIDLSNAADSVWGSALHINPFLWHATCTAAGSLKG